MSSMKLFKPSYSYGANHKSFSEYEHQESRIQSNYANNTLENKFNASSYDSLAQEHCSARSIGDFDAYESSHGRANKSVNHYAHAQRALPSPSIHVQQGHHGLQKMNRQESRIGQDWASNSPKCSSPTLGGNSNLTMHNKNNMAGEMEHGWQNKPNQYSSQGQAYHLGQSKYNEREQAAYDSDESDIEDDYASKGVVLTSPKYLSPIKTNQPSIVTQNNEAHMMGKMDHGWANANSKYSIPTPVQAQHSGLGVHEEDHMMGKSNIGWANSNSQFPSPTQVQAQRSSLGMHKEGHMMGKTNAGWANSPTKFSSPSRTNQSGLTTGHMMKKNDHDWSSPNQFSDSSQLHHADKAMHDEEHRAVGKMDRGWANVRNNFSGPAQTHHSGLAMHKDAHMMGKVDQSMSNSLSNYSSPAQTHNSGSAMHKEEHTMGNKSLGWANSPAKYSGPNNFNSSNYTMHGEHDRQHGWGGKSSNGYGTNQLNHSAYTSYADYDQCVDEDVHDIMDEILTKYPAHNVSGGHGGSYATKGSTYATQNMAAGYGKQQGFGGSANYGSAAQSMASSSSNFAMKKEMNAQHSSSFKKEEYSASSSAKKFEANSMMRRAGYC